ncbi:MAG: CRISPR-associated endonuclease Cas2 [Proteobacteria bacterium]|nr:CRISPR-associated endonuclease Cas2 [Pseudomonadota bacterium]
MNDEHLYIVTYDIADEKRWRAIFKLMHGYGEWMQLSVFQCRLGRARHAELTLRLTETISAAEDHVLVIDLGVAENVEPRVRSLGKRSFEAVQRVPVIV